MSEQVRQAPAPVPQRREAPGAVPETPWGVPEEGREARRDTPERLDALRRSATDQHLAALEARERRAELSAGTVAARETAPQAAAPARVEKGFLGGIVGTVSAMAATALSGLKLSAKEDSWRARAADTLIGFFGGAKDPVTLGNNIARSIRKAGLLVLSSPALLGLDKIPFLGGFFEGKKREYMQLLTMEALAGLVEGEGGHARQGNVILAGGMPAAAWKQLEKRAKDDGAAPADRAAELAAAYIARRRAEDTGDMPKWGTPGRPLYVTLPDILRDPEEERKAREKEETDRKGLEEKRQTDDLKKLFGNAAEIVYGGETKKAGGTVTIAREDLDEHGLPKRGSRAAKLLGAAAALSVATIEIVPSGVLELAREGADIAVRIPTASAIPLEHVLALKGMLAGGGRAAVIREGAAMMTAKPLVQFVIEGNRGVLQFNGRTEIPLLVAHQQSLKALVDGARDGQQWGWNGSAWLPEA